MFHIKNNEVFKGGELTVKRKNKEKTHTNVFCVCYADMNLFLQVCFFTMDFCVDKRDDKESEIICTWLSDEQCREKVEAPLDLCMTRCFDLWCLWQAKQCLVQALEYRRHEVSYVMLGKIHLMDGDIKQAIDTYRAAVE